MTKFEVMEICNAHDIPVGPILSMKEIAEEQSLRDTGTVVEVDHPTRGKYLTVGNPVKMSDSITEVKRSPLLGEHTDEISAQGARLQRQGDRRDQDIGRGDAAGEACQGGGGVNHCLVMRRACPGASTLRKVLPYRTGSPGQARRSPAE